MADLSITITVPDAQLERMLNAFKRRFRNPNLTQEQMLYGLKATAMQQINAVVVAEEQSVLDELKSGVTPLDLA